ncbi:MAG: hypothetical protein ACLQU3_28035 [Limisphaerales bacterium]
MPLTLPLTFILAMAGVAAYLAAVIAALVVHGVWVAPFIERQGERTAGFFAHWMLGGAGLVRGYMTARRLCKQRGVRPLWMRWFGLLLVVAAILAAGTVVVVLSSLRDK